LEITTFDKEDFAHERNYACEEKGMRFEKQIMTKPI
jgi:hypothetical protein